MRPAFAKDAFHRYVIDRDADAVNPAREGTKAAAHYVLTVPRAKTVTVRLRLNDRAPGRGANPLGRSFDETVEQRRTEADEFYATVIPATLSEDAARVARQAFAGLLWSKQFYHYVVKDWLDGDPRQPAPPADRQYGRNNQWTHLYNADVISMPDKWEYPWYAAWDLAFHCVPLALVDSEFAKDQLLLLLREWYMHPNGQLPAYEWALGDVNPPVHAWAALARVPDREEATRRRRSRVPRAHLSEAAAELHLVGEPQGRRRDERLPGRLPRARQHRRLRSQRAAADRRTSRAVGRHELDGDVLAQHARHRH